jgi:hypothetical protein
MRQGQGHNAHVNWNRNTDCITLAAEDETSGGGDSQGFDPSAPPLLNIQPDTAYSSPPGAEEPDNTSTVEATEQENTQLVYSIELLIFSFIGWGWLAIREFLGNTPVMDATVILVTIVSSILNLLACVFFSEPHLFQPFARAHLSHMFSLWVFYLYSLIESMAAGNVKVCCGTAMPVTISLAQSYTSTYFGGIQFYQAFCVITLAYLTVCVFISAAQARACAMQQHYQVDKNHPVSWSILRGTVSAIAILVSLHCAMFAIRAPLCNRMSDYSAGVMSIAILAWISMSDLYEIYTFIWKKIDKTIPWQVRLKAGYHLIDFSLVITLLGTTAGLAGTFGNSFPVATTFLLVAEFINFAVMLLMDIAEVKTADAAAMRKKKEEKLKELEQSPDAITPQAASMFTIGRNYQGQGRSKNRW